MPVPELLQAFLDAICVLLNSLRGAGRVNEEGYRNTRYCYRCGQSIMSPFVWGCVGVCAPEGRELVWVDEQGLRRGHIK